jgi:hypothetical protein
MKTRITISSYQSTSGKKFAGFPIQGCFSGCGFSYFTQQSCCLLSGKDPGPEGHFFVGEYSMQEKQSIFKHGMEKSGRHSGSYSAAAAEHAQSALWG